MNRERLRFVIWSVVTGGIVVLGSLLGIAPQLDAAGAATAERHEVEAQNSDQEAVLAALAEHFANPGALQTDLAQLQVSVPVDDDLPAFVAQLDAIAVSSGVTVEQVTVSDGAGFVVADDGQDAAASNSADDGNSAHGVSNGSAEMADTAAALAARLAPDQYISIPVVVDVSGASVRVLDFLTALQHGERLVAINGFSTESVDDLELVSLSITAEIYVLRDLSK